MSDHPGPFYCPAFQRQYPGGPQGPACLRELPCAEHGIQDQNQGHREYGAVITMALEEKPNDTVLLLMPNGGGLQISREAFDDAVEMGAPIRDYLVNAFQERT